MHTKATLTALAESMNAYLVGHAEPAAANWLPALKADPKIGRLLGGLEQDHGNIVDSYGTPIEYVPSHTPPWNQPNGYFRSAGADQVFDTMDDIISIPVAQ